MYDFLIVGGGAIGLSLAWELAGRGKSVCLLESGELGRAASWAGAGILPPPKVLATHDPMEQLRAISHRLHFDWSDRLKAETQVDNQLLRSGGIYLARKAGEAATLRVEMQQSETDGVSVDVMDARKLAEFEPQLNAVAEDVVACFYLNDELMLRSPRHLKALAAGCAQRGVRLVTNAPISDLQVQSGRVQSVMAAEETFVADQVCLCTGAWTAKLLQPLGVVLPVEPWRGQLILWKTDRPLLSHVVNEGYRYFVPRQDGRLVVGATVEDVGFDDSTTTEALEELRTYSCEIMPQLRDQQVLQTWAGLRPGTPDGRPFLDRVPGVDNLAVACGHYRSGLHVSPATAVLMSQLLLSENPDIDLGSFRINR